METQTQRTDLWTWKEGEEGEGGKYGESNMETYITICKIDAGGNLLYGSGNSSQGSVTTQRGGMGGGGREVQEGEDVCVPVADSC